MWAFLGLKAHTFSHTLLIATLLVESKPPPRVQNPFIGILVESASFIALVQTDIHTYFSQDFYGCSKL